MNYETIIGLEIHAELKTKSKIFCGCSTQFASEPNANTCPVCLGLPGTLPVLNEEAVRLAVKAGTALNCKVNHMNKFDRKNYFYPDLPKAYQISQYDMPVCTDGAVEFECGGRQVKVRINRVHLEEDAGKLIHLEDEPYSLVDYNRAGIPLIEIVTEPDMRSPVEAVTFMRMLKSILEYCEISDCRMEQGSLRCDANISVRPAGQKEFGTKVELKNINSFRELQKALEKEEKRQIELYRFGESHKIIQETRRWDSGKGRTVSMRSKEEAHDYRYFPEPDLLPVIIDEAAVSAIKDSLPELPMEKYRRFTQEYGLSGDDADILTGDRHLSEYFESTVSEGAAPKTAANWVLGDVLRMLNESGISSSEIPVDPVRLRRLISMVEEGKISNTAGREVFREMFVNGGSPEEIVEKKGLTQISSEDAILELVRKVIAENPKSVEDYRGGKTKAMGYLVGQVMKESKGRANPSVVNELLTKELNRA
ncbi:MAG TPA: Asp-tRNA(Asn)/Glu-tRNA(Gln) amidotransferase subunit GatB [Clostridiales bacterium]|nr:Asp-tRNA(Asn)/Glu-tRNA(Gln) amidotransferase subunit GatB [Clostridiales bacterium]HPV00873.1 Asp-tRNA(Asn)/Glu-tRNA(Gln) amidotransferase subunit GatB [Clostridiales bacterium]